jgi:Thrombospondin type 3 repeat/Bacterial Ig domain
MRGLVVVACALIALVVAPGARADVTIGSTLPPPEGGVEGCADGCTRSTTVIDGQQVIAPSRGIITRWRIRAGGTVGAVRFVVLGRSSGPGAQPAELAGRSAEVIPTRNIVSLFDVRIPILAGEYIGIEWAADGEYFATVATTNTDNWSPPVAPGTSHLATTTNREVLVSADIEPDSDGDAFGDESQDNCRDNPNPDQQDADGDGLGDACDPDADRDGDGVANASDVCPTVAGTAPNGCPAGPQPARVNTPAIVRFRTPLVGTAVGASQLIELDVSDDFGRPTVTVFDDDGTICTLTGAPYSCTWNPTGADVGRATLLASAVDVDNRSSLASVRVRVARFKGDLTARRRGRQVSGRLVLPSAVEKALGCRGQVTVRRGKVRRTSALKRNCTYSVRLPRGSGRVRARFAGNSVAEPAT